MLRVQVQNTRNQALQTVQDQAALIEGLARTLRINAQAGRVRPDTVQRILRAALHIDRETGRFLDHEIILLHLAAAERQVASERPAA